MGEITIDLPPELEAEIDNLVSRGIYKGKDEAIIALIRAGLRTFKKREEPKVYHVPGEHPAIPPVKPPEKWPDHFEFK